MLPRSSVLCIYMDVFLYIDTCFSLFVFARRVVEALIRPPPMPDDDNDSHNNDADGSQRKNVQESGTGGGRKDGSLTGAAASAAEIRQPARWPSDCLPQEKRVDKSRSQGSVGVETAAFGGRKGDDSCAEEGGVDVGRRRKEEDEEEEEDGVGRRRAPERARPLSTEKGKVKCLTEEEEEEDDDEEIFPPSPFPGLVIAVDEM